MTDPTTIACSAPQHDVVVEANTMLPLRDGVCLATDVYLPARDGVRLDGSFLLSRFNVPNRIALLNQGILCHLPHRFGISTDRFLTAYQGNRDAS